jgi:hypothetical protein
MTFNTLHISSRSWFLEDSEYPTCSSSKSELCFLPILWLYGLLSHSQLLILWFKEQFWMELKHAQLTANNWVWGCLQDLSGAIWVGDCGTKDHAAPCWLLLVTWSWLVWKPVLHINITLLQDANTITPVNTEHRHDTWNLHQYRASVILSICIMALDLLISDLKHNQSLHYRAFLSSRQKYIFLAFTEHRTDHHCILKKLQWLGLHSGEYI